MLVTGIKYEQRINRTMPEGLSFFMRSPSPDRVKQKQLCALCASVVSLNKKS
jgi:hypothetical protein